MEPTLESPKRNSRVFIWIAIAALVALSVFLSLSFFGKSNPTETAQIPVIELPFEYVRVSGEPAFASESSPGSIVYPGNSQDSSSPTYARLDLATQESTTQSFFPEVEGRLEDTAYGAPGGDGVAYIHQNADGTYVVTFFIQGEKVSYGSINTLSHVALSPDNFKVAFSAFVQEDTADETGMWKVMVAEFSSATNGVLVSSFETNGYAPEFVSDSRIVYLKDGAIYAQDIEGGEPERIADIPSYTVPEQFKLFDLPSLAVSDDKTMLALSIPLLQKIFIVDISDGVVSNEAFFSSAKTITTVGFGALFSPDGKYIATYNPFEGTVIFSLETLSGWVAAPLYEGVTLNNPLFDWVVEDNL